MSDAPAGRPAPECITLGVREGATPAGGPPVRIFLGTEAAQFRAERVLVWSIEQVRDPGRVYEIHLMKELAGFDRSGWTTGFTNYRFAIPDFAGRAGRAIYNDEDQIYLSDPAALFDLDLGGHGFLAISPTESSVMVMDCARMAEVWSLEDARRLGKKTLLRRAAARPGLLGPLAPGWNARDEEPVDGPVHLRHFTTLHTQPWRPFPDRFVYQDNPLAHLWHELERSADAAGFQLFSRRRPTTRFAALRGRRREGTPAADAELDAALRALREATGAEQVADYDAFADAPPAPADGLVARGLGAVPEDDLPWVLDELLAGARRFVLIAADCAGSRTDPRATESFASAERWPELLAWASRRRPEVHWELLLRRRDARGTATTVRHRGGRYAGAAQPVVHVLEDRDGGAASALAQTLGFPFERRRPDNGAAEPPWPDLVISQGARAARVARHLRARAAGATRVVHIGPEQGACAEAYDLVVTPRSAGFFPHPHRLETALPLPGAPGEPGAAVDATWRERFDRAPAPRIALLVDTRAGASLAPEALGALGAAAARAARDAGGSLFALLPAGLPRAAAAALEPCLAAAHVHRRAGDGLDDPLRAHLVLADALFATGGDEALLAEASASGRPLTLAPPAPARRRGREWLRGFVTSQAVAARSNDRGTVRPQQGVERFCSRLIARGRVRPPHAPERACEALVERGVARLAGAPECASKPLRELEDVAARVRALLGLR